MDCLPSQYDIYIYMLVFLSLSQKSETNFNPFGSFFYEPKPQYSLNVTTLEKQDFTSPEKEYLFFFFENYKKIIIKELGNYISPLQETCRATSQNDKDIG